MNSDEQHTSCPGFLDEFGIWNNGFECPPLANQIRVCCGSDSRRYCCILQQFHNNSSKSIKKSFLANLEANLSLIKKFDFTLISLPIQLTCILILILFFLLIFVLIIIICIRSRRRKARFIEEEPLSTKQTLLNIDHFPFSPPHHQLYFQNNRQSTKDTLTTSISSLSATPATRLPSDFHSNDWITMEQSPYRYHPTLSNEMKKYLYHDKYQQEDIIV